MEWKNAGEGSDRNDGKDKSRLRSFDFRQMATVTLRKI